PGAAGFHSQRGSNWLQIRRKALLVHVDTDADHCIAHPRDLGIHLCENSAEFALAEHDIVGPTKIGTNGRNTLNGITHGESRDQRKQKCVGGSQRGTQDHRRVDPFGCSGLPAVPSAAATCRLLFGEKDRSLRLALRSGLHRNQVRGCGSKEMVNSSLENRAAKQRLKNVRQQEVRNSLQAISGGRVSGDLDAQFTQLLDEAPDLGAARTQFVGDLCTAHDEHGIVCEQANDVSESSVRAWARVQRCPARVRTGLGAGIHEGWRNYPAQNQLLQAKAAYWALAWAAAVRPVPGAGIRKGCTRYPAQSQWRKAGAT